jgi:hypothetical protein
MRVRQTSYLTKAIVPLPGWYRRRPSPQHGRAQAATKEERRQSLSVRARTDGATVLA